MIWQDKGRLVALVTDDYEHHRNLNSELMQAVYDCRCVSAQDTTHKTMELERVLPFGSTSARRFRVAFAAAQARFGAPRAPTVAGAVVAAPRVCLPRPETLRLAVVTGQKPSDEEAETLVEGHKLKD